MPILNYDLLDKNIYKNIRNWSIRNYWYVPVDINNKLIVPPEIIFGKAVIVVCTEFEGYYEIVEKIYKELVIELNISPNRILLISENADLTEHIFNTAKQYETEPIKYEWSLIAQLYVKRQVVKNLSNLKNIRPKTNVSNKYFLNFNRRWRLHRPTLVALLYASGLLDKGHVSLGKADGMYDNWLAVINDIICLVEKDEMLIKLIKDNIESIINLNPLYLDTKILNFGKVELYHDDIEPASTENLYKDTAFSLVTETYFIENEGRFLTEKTYKPISYHHPFILVAKPFSLKLLREIGYQTFHPFIDESYDEEIDHVKRLRMILKEVERLCSMTDDELILFLKNVQSITEHNFNRLTTTVDHIYKKI